MLRLHFLAASMPECLSKSLGDMTRHCAAPSAHVGQRQTTVRVGMIKVAGTPLQTTGTLLPVGLAGGEVGMVRCGGPTLRSPGDANRSGTSRR